MPSLISSLSSLLLVTTSPVLADYLVDSSFKIDVHSHVVPEIYRSALIKAGYPVPTWNLSTHIASMDTLGVNYSTLSISAPGVIFLANDSQAASTLARQLNNAMYNYTQQYPTRLGAMCLLPLPHIDAALAEIEYCLDTLSFDGIGLYTNWNGTYLGSPSLSPILDSINNRSATVFVHPSAPGCSGADIGYPDPMTEYPFESVRAMQNLLLTGQRANYSGINIIFPHGGGAIPYLAARIAGIASLPFLGGLNATGSLAQFKGYLFDTASAADAVHLGAMMKFFGNVSRIVTGTDYPYVPLAQSLPALEGTQAAGGFTDDEMAQVNNQNVLSVFPRIAAKLEFVSR